MQADVRYNASLVEDLELPWWLVPVLAYEAMVYKLLAARARRLMICSWVKVPEGAVYTQWLRGVQMAWLSQQLGRVVQPEEMRWFFALNTEGEDPEDDLLDWVSKLSTQHASQSQHASLSRPAGSEGSCSPARLRSTLTRTSAFAAVGLLAPGQSPSGLGIQTRYSGRTHRHFP